MREWRYWRNLLLFGSCILIVGLAIGIMFVARQAALGYLHPVRSSYSPEHTPARQSISFEDTVLTTADELHLSAWYTPPQNGAVILIAHGYGSKRPAVIHSLFVRNGYGALSWDFRAHGASEGQLCTLGYYEALDVEAALDFALSQPAVKRVGAWGGSMGGATVILAAARRPEIEAVVADSAFATLEEQLDKQVPLGFLRPVIRWFAERETGLSIHAVRPVDQISLISPRPVLIIQGLADTMIPIGSAQSLYSAAGDPRTLWSEPGVGHLRMYNSVPNVYESRVISFFDSALLKQD